MAVGPVDVYIHWVSGQQVHGTYRARDHGARGERHDPDPRSAFHHEGCRRRRDDARVSDLDEDGAGFVGIDVTQPGALGPEDAEEVNDDLPANSAALLIAFENLWVGKVVDALRAADAVLIDQIRIPVDVVEAFEAS